MLSGILIHQNFAKEAAIPHIMAVEVCSPKYLSLSVSMGTRPGEALSSCVLMLCFAKSGRPFLSRFIKDRVCLETVQMSNAASE